MASTKNPGQEQGTSGLGYAQGGTVEEELHPRLSGRQAITVYRDMSDNDPLVSAILYSIDMLVRQVEWHVEQGEGTEQDVEFLTSCMEDMSHSWADLISEVMSMLRFGFSFHEIVYKRRSGPQEEGSKIPSSRFKDNKIGWRKIPMRAQETLDRWTFEDDGSVSEFVQKAPPLYKEVPIPILKGLLFRTTAYKGNPEGRSLLRGAYRPWFYKKRIEEIEGVGVERDLAGFPVFDLPSDYLSASASDDEKAVVAAFKEIGKNLRRDKQEYLLMPTAYDENNNKIMDFRLMTSGGARSFDTTAIIGRYDQRIAMTVLADFILLGHEKVGSFALSDNKTDLFAIALGTILDVVEDVFNRFAVPRLWALNGFNMEKMPKIVHGDIEDPDIEALGTYLQALASLGMTLFPDQDLEKYLREAANLPAVSEETLKEREKTATESNDAKAAPDANGAPADPTQGGANGANADSPPDQPVPNGQ